MNINNENLNKKCSLKKHSEINAINYCAKCKLYLCNKCKNFHTELFEAHHLFDLNKDINTIYTGYCKEKKHNNELEYFCKNHNQLCCAACIAKIGGEGNGQHSNCQVSFIKDIKEEKKNNLESNMKCLEDLFCKLEESLNNIKNYSQILIENKDSVKLKIQKTFTKIRNILNEREDELMLEVDKIYNLLFSNENIIEESKKHKNYIKKSLDEEKINDKEWNDNNLNLYINHCLNIENNIKYVKKLNELIKKCNLHKNITFDFNPNENDISQKFINKIKTFGIIENNKIKSKIISLNDYFTINNWLNENIGNIQNYELIDRINLKSILNPDIIQNLKKIPNLFWLMKDKKNNILGCFHSVELENLNRNSKSFNCFLYSINNDKKLEKNFENHTFEFEKEISYFSLEKKSLFIYFENGNIFKQSLVIDNDSGDCLIEFEIFKVIQ